MTVLYSPPGYSSAHDDLIFTVQDAHATDPTNYPNYKYIADVVVNGVQVARLKKVPDPVNNIGIFNIEQVVRNYVNAVFNPTTNLQSQELGRSQFYIDIQVNFGEEYNYTSYLNLTGTGIKAYNNYNRQLYGQPSSLTGKADSIITNASALQAYSNQQYLFLSYFATTTGSVTIQITPDNGSLFSTTFTPSSGFTGQILNISPNTINALSPGKINAGTSYYTVKIGSTSLKVWLVCDPRYQTYEIHFLNQYGGFDTKLFNKVSRKTVNPITRSSFGRLAYAVDSGGQVSYYNSNNVYNEQEYVYASQFTEKMQLNSDLLRDADYVWLYDLIVSPQVYINLNGYFIPCVITDTSYEAKKIINDQLTNLTINIEFGKTYNAQYR